MLHELIPNYLYDTRGFVLSKDSLQIFKEMRKPEVKPNTTFDLASEPTISELKFLTIRYAHENGLAHFNKTNDWKTIKGGRKGIDIPKDIRKKADIVAHTHPLLAVQNPAVKELIDLPGFGDIIVATKNKTKEFLIHLRGITYYTGITIHPLTGEKLKQADLKNLNLYPAWRSFLDRYVFNNQITNRSFNQLYKEEFLEKMGATIIQKTWQELPKENPLSSFAKEV